MSSTIVVLSASSGGGHNAAANAILQRIRAHYGDVYQYKIVDIYRNNLVSRLPGLAKVRYQSDLIWQLFLRLTNNRQAVKLISFFMRPWMVRLIGRELPENTSHLIAVHFNPAQVLKSLANRFSSPPQTSIVVTDFDPHWAWLGEGSDQLFVVSDSGVERARSLGYNEDALTKLQVVPVDEIQHRCTQRQPGSPLNLLLISGQEGSNEAQIVRLVKLVDQLGHKARVKLTVVCGNNDKLRKSIDRLSSDLNAIELDVQGYVANIAQTFHTYDLMLMRTSPGVLSESISAGIPVLGFDWTAHEVYQTTYINEHGLGLASRDAGEHARFLSRVIDDSSFLSQLYQNVDKVREKIDYQGFVQRLVQGAK